MRRDDAGRHRAAEAERVADGEHPVADARVLLRELDEREGLAVGLDLDQGNVGARVGADQRRRIFVAVLHRDGDVLGVLDHVVVGHDEAVRRDEEARALRQSRRRLLLLLRHAFAELLEEVVERVVLGQIGHARDLVVLGDLGVALDVDADHRGANPGDEVGEGQRRAPLGHVDGRLGGSGLGGGERHQIAERQP